jgi:hypothetical protein
MTNVGKLLVFWKKFSISQKIEGKKKTPYNTPEEK